MILPSFDASVFEQSFVVLDRIEPCQDDMPRILSDFTARYEPDPHTILVRLEKIWSQVPI